jgi:hypothetical protein
MYIVNWQETCRRRREIAYNDRRKKIIFAPLLTPYNPKIIASALALCARVAIIFLNAVAQNMSAPKKPSIARSTHLKPIDWWVLMTVAKRQFVSGVIHSRKSNRSNCLDFLAPPFVSRQKVEIKQKKEKFELKNLCKYPLVGGDANKASRA